MTTNITEFPKLFSQNEDGSVNEWKIWVHKTNDGAFIFTRYGRVGGAMQDTSDKVTEGKNIGKKNETSAYEQAVKEAKSKWEKQQKKGYNQSLAKAEKGQIDTSFIAGGIDPMLAHKWRDHSAKMPLPALAQPKFDGIRCIAIIKNGKATLWSRTRKAITGVPHIKLHLEALFPGKDVILDGELYNHDYKDRFEDIVSYVRQQTAKPGHEVVQYHVYDVVLVGQGNEARQKWLDANLPTTNAIRVVDTVEVKTKEDVENYLAACLEAGYEGCMVRSKAGTYQHKRSYNLLKVKEFEDAEFEIVGTEEGRGKMAGKAIFVCKTKKGETFNVKMKGSLDNLAKYLNNKKVIGKQLTVRYQGFTNGDVPRFPVGVAIRDYE